MQNQHVSNDGIPMQQTNGNPAQQEYMQQNNMYNQQDYPQQDHIQQNQMNQQHTQQDLKHPPPTYNSAQNGSPLANPPMVNSSPNTPIQHQGHPPPQQQQQPYPQNGDYQHQSIPIGALQSQSAPVVCPSCGVRAMTEPTSESGGFTHGVAALVCFFTCLGCIPYCISSLKDVHHRCGNCKMPLATFHRSGRTEISGSRK